MIKINVGSQDLNHPQSNVLAENAVKQAKNLFCMCNKDSYICVMFLDIKLGSSCPATHLQANKVHYSCDKAVRHPLR